MNFDETIKSWNWRIVRGWHTHLAFCKEVGISQGTLSRYISGRIIPKLHRFEYVEKKLKQREAELGYADIC
jgi:transcriptional regulator with XRE-family HTH domain